jgi:hypothetical protein
LNDQNQNINNLTNIEKNYDPDQSDFGNLMVENTDKSASMSHSRQPSKNIEKGMDVSQARSISQVVDAT